MHCRTPQYTPAVFQVLTLEDLAQEFAHRKARRTEYYKKGKHQDWKRKHRLKAVVVEEVVELVEPEELAAAADKDVVQPAVLVVAVVLVVEEGKAGL